MNHWKFISGAVLASMVVVGCGKGAGGTLATVDGDNITMEQFYKYMEAKPTARIQIARGTPIAQNGEVEGAVVGTVAFQSLYEMVMQRLLLQIARDEGVMPSDKDVASELEFRKKLNPNYVEQAQAGGLNLSQIRERLQLDLAREKVVTKGVTVSMQEVEQYIKEHPEQFTDPDMYDMKWILVSTKESQATADKDLTSGQAFHEVARRYSEDEESKKRNNIFGTKDIRALPQEIQDAIKKTPEGQTTAWLNVGNGFAKFLIEKKTPSKPMVLSDAQKTAVQRDLALQRGSAAVDIAQRLQDRLLDKIDKIEVKYSPVVDVWKKFKERVNAEKGKKSADSGASASTGETGASTAPPAEGK